MTGQNADVLYADVVARLDEKSFRQIEREAEEAAKRAANQFGEGFTRDVNGKLRDANGRFVRGLDGLADSAGKVGEQAGEQLAEGYYRDATGRLRNANGKFVKDMDRVVEGAERTGEQAGGRLSGAFGSAMSRLPALAAGAAVAVGAALVGGASAAVNAFADFEQTLSGAQAVLSATAGEMEALKKSALEMGATTSFSASESAKAIEELGSAGLSTADILNGGLKGALDLAAATGMKDLTKASEIAAATLNNFGLAGEDMARVADIVAKAANISAVTVEDFGNAVAQGGSSAKAAGLSIEEYTAAVGAMADVGIKGSDAGTSLKSFFAALVPDSEEASKAMKKLGLSFFDANGNMKDLAGIQDTLKSSFAGLTQEQRLMYAQTIFGSDGIRAFNTILDDNTGKLGKNTQALRDSNGEAAKAAKTRLDNLKGDVDQFRGALESASIRIGETLTKGLNLQGIVQNATSTLNALAPAVDGVLKTVLPVLTKFGSGVNTALSPYLSKAQELFKSVFTALAPIVQAAMTALAPVVRNIGPLFGAAFTLVKTLWDTVLRPVLVAITPLLTGTVATIGNVLNVAVRVVTGVVNAISALFRGDFAGAVRALQGVFEDGATFVVRQVRNLATTVLGLIRNLVPQMADAAGDILSGLVKGIEGGVGRVVQSARKLANGIIGGITGTLKIQSPSKVMEELGQFTAEGFVRGISSKDEDVRRAARTTVREFKTAFADLKNEAKVGDVGMGEYIATLEKVSATLRAKTKTVQEGTPAYHEWYAALTQVEKELSLVKGKTSALQTASKEAADELARNRKAIQDGINFDAFVTGLSSLTDAQLASQRSAAQAAGDQQAFNAVLNEQKTRASEAAQAVSDLASAQIAAANGAAQRDPQGAADAAYRRAFGAGDEGLIRSLSAVTGKSIADVRADVEGALTDAQRFAKTSAEIIARVYADALTHRRDVAEQQKQVEADVAANVQAQNDALYAGLDALGNGYEKDRTERAADAAAIIQQQNDALYAGLDALGNGYEKDRVEREADATAEIQRQNDALYAGLDKLGSEFAAEEERNTARAIEMADERRAAIVEGYRAEQAAAEDAGLTVEFLTGLVQEAVSQGRDIRAEGGVLAYLKNLTEGSGQAAAAAQEVIDRIAQIEFRAQTPGPISGPVAARGVVDYTRPVDARGALSEEAEAWKKKTAAQEASLRLQEEYRQSLSDLTLNQLEAAKAQAYQRGEMEKYQVIVGEIQALTDRPLTLTLHVAGIDTGIKALDLYKSAISGVAGVITDTFKGLVSGAEVSTTSILKSMALMALGIVKQVAVAIAAYEAQAIALALISGASLNFVQAGLALAAAAAVAGIVAGLEAKLGQTTGTGTPTPGTGSTTGSGATANGATPSNSQVQIPTSQVTVLAAPEFVSVFGGHVDRFGGWVDRLTGQGIRVASDVRVSGSGGLTAFDIATP